MFGSYFEKHCRVVYFQALPRLPLVQQLGTVLRLLSAYNVVLPSLYSAGGAMDLRTLMDGVQRAVSDDSSSSSLASSKLRVDLLRLVVATGITAKQLLKKVCYDLHCMILMLSDVSVFCLIVVRSPCLHKFRFLQLRCCRSDYLELPLSLSFPVGGTCHRPNRLQEAHHASWVGRVDVVGGGACLYVGRTAQEQMLSCLVIASAVRTQWRLLASDSV